MTYRGKPRHRLRRSRRSTRVTRFRLGRLLQTDAARALPGALRPAAHASRASGRPREHRQNVSPPKGPPVALQSWGRAPGTSSTEPRLRRRCGMAFGWGGGETRLDLLPTRGATAPASLRPAPGPFQLTGTVSYQGPTRFLWDCLRTSFRWESPGPTDRKRQRRSRHFPERLFLASQ